MAATKKNEDKIEDKIESVAATEGEKKVTIRLPRSKEQSGGVFVSVNERTFLIQRGVPVTVPASVAEVIATSERYAEEAEKFDESVRK